LVGAGSGLDLNWRAACRARSHKEFTAKLGTVLEEADEAEECLDLIHDGGVADGDELRRLRIESKELRSIFAKAARTASANEERARRPKRNGQPRRA
jgi:four helix bundle protein